MLCMQRFDWKRDERRRQILKCYLFACPVSVAWFFRFLFFNTLQTLIRYSFAILSIANHLPFEAHFASILDCSRSDSLLIFISIRIRRKLNILKCLNFISNSTNKFFMRRLHTHTDRDMERKGNKGKSLSKENNAMYTSESQWEKTTTTRQDVKNSFKIFSIKRNQ